MFLLIEFARMRTFIGLLLNLYTKAGLNPSAFEDARTCSHQSGLGSAPEPYALHSMHHFPSIRSGSSFVLVCSKILFTGFFKLRSSMSAFAICLSKAAPLFLEFIDKTNL